MASFTNNDYKRVYDIAVNVHISTKNRVIKDMMKELIEMVENCIGQQDRGREIKK